MKFNFKKINWYLVGLYLALAAILIVMSMKTISIYQNDHTIWYVRSVNSGFVLVTDQNVNNNIDDIIVRNPVPGLKPGDKVLVKGFSYFDLPFIVSKQ